MNYKYNPANFKTDLSGISEAGQGLGSAFSSIGSEGRAEDANTRANSAEDRLKAMQPGKELSQKLNNEGKATSNRMALLNETATGQAVDKNTYLNRPASEDDYDDAINTINRAQATLNSKMMDDQKLTQDQRLLINQTLDQNTQALRENSYTKSAVKNGVLKILKTIEGYSKQGEDGLSDLEKKSKEADILYKRAMAFKANRSGAKDKEFDPTENDALAAKITDLAFKAQDKVVNLNSKITEAKDKGLDITKLNEELDTAKRLSQQLTLQASNLRETVKGIKAKKTGVTDNSKPASVNDKMISGLKSPKTASTQNSKGQPEWRLMTDANGNKAEVEFIDGKQTKNFRPIK